MYDTVESRHITVDGVRQLIVAGEEIQVIDDTTGNDVTRSLLMQIVADQEQAGRPILDTNLLTTIIRFYGHPMQEMMGSYLGNAVNHFVDQQQSMQDQLQAMLDPKKTASLLQQATENNLQAWEAMQKAFMSPFSSGNAGSAPRSEDDADKQ